MTQPAIFISQELLSDSLSKVGNPGNFRYNISALIDNGVKVAVGPESAPVKVFKDSNDFHDWFSAVQQNLERNFSEDSDPNPDYDDPQIQAIEHINMMEARGLSTDDESLSSKGMDQAEVRAGLRGPD